MADSWVSISEISDSHDDDSWLSRGAGYESKRVPRKKSLDFLIESDTQS